MINRALLRIKAVQNLYAYYKSESGDLRLAESELQHSIKKAYDLYYALLDLIIETTHYAQLREDAISHKLQKVDVVAQSNGTLVDNRFAKQLAENEMLLSYVSENAITWSEHEEVIRDLYDRILTSDYYIAYQQSSNTDYNIDRDFWVKVLKKEILNNELLAEAMEDMSIYWLDDLDIVLSFVVKTCRSFDEKNGASQPLMPMYKDDNDFEFVMRLYQNAIINADEYRALIDKYTSNWDIERIAFMDILIMQLALAELLNFPTIPINVTLNEYIELAKVYSTSRSGNFVNGVLDKIVAELKKEGKLQKL